jgi:hypothetical protein
MATLPINELKRAPTFGGCADLNLHRCKQSLVGKYVFTLYYIVDDITEKLYSATVSCAKIDSFDDENIALYVNGGVGISQLTSLVNASVKFKIYVRIDSILSEQQERQQAEQQTKQQERQERQERQQAAIQAEAAQQTRQQTRQATQAPRAASYNPLMMGGAKNHAEESHTGENRIARNEENRIVVEIFCIVFSRNYTKLVFLEVQIIRYCPRPNYTERKEN